MGDLFGIFGNIKKNFFFKKVHYFWVWRLFVVIYCDFGEFDGFLGLEFAFLLFVFCLRLNFGLCSVVRSALSPWFYIVVKKEDMKPPGLDVVVPTYPEQAEGSIWDASWLNVRRGSLLGMFIEYLNM